MFNGIIDDNSYISMIRYITTEELEQALREYGMHDGRDIKEIISEVDADNVSQKYKEAKEKNEMKKENSLLDGFS